MFITFEGGEGTGKTTQIKLLAKYFRAGKKKVLTTFEPGGTRLGKFLRSILLQNKNISPLAELLLFAADRAEHVDKVIKKAIKAGHLVLCDRYIDSTSAYQVGGRKLASDLVESINQVSSLGIKPDLTFLLDVPVKVGLKRVKVITKFEKQKLAFHQRVRSYFLKIASLNPKRIKVIDCGNGINAVHEEIVKICKAKIFGV